MHEPALPDADSPLLEGGSIPGGAAGPAFTLTAPRPSALPVLISVPHAGRAYPASLLERMRNPGVAALKLEDRYVDRLGHAVAGQTGAALLVAHAPRAMIDLNRDPGDVDWEMFAGQRPDQAGSFTPGPRARSGLGLIPRRIQGLGELWNRRHAAEELPARINAIHAPYHHCLGASLAELQQRWGAALLIDLHSMPPLDLHGRQIPPEFVLGDRFGTSCHGALVGACFDYFSGFKRRAAHNRPYAGGYVLERHAAPDRGVHALQLEIDRTSYLDSRLAEPGPGFAAMVALLSGLVRRLAGEVADLGQARNWARAAE